MAIRSNVWLASVPKTLLLTYVGICLTLLAVSLLLSGFGQNLERELGLRLLFALRGAQPPPGQVVIVAINDHTARAIGVPESVERYQRCEDFSFDETHGVSARLPSASRMADWPRCLHARLVDALRELGARAIVFDITFRKRDPYILDGQDVRLTQDHQLAGAMRRAGNVLLATKAYRFKEPDARTPVTDAVASSAELPDPLRREAVGVGPLHLADTGAPYGRLYLYSNADAPRPSVLVLALGYMLKDAFPEIRDRLSIDPTLAAGLVSNVEDLLVAGELDATTMQLRQALKNGEVARHLAGGSLRHSDGMRPALSLSAQRWLATLAADPTLQVNFYGPPGTVDTVRYEDLLRQRVPEFARERVQGRAVFIGYAETTRPEQLDHFESYFSRDDGVHFSGVELAATAFANLLEDSGIKRVPGPGAGLIVILFAFGPLAIVLYQPKPVGYAMALGAGLVYVLIALALFRYFSLWLPIVIPVAILLPLALVISLAYQALRQSWRRSELEGFLGRLLPREVVERIRENTQRLGLPGDSAQGACIATDAERFSSLSEQLPPASLVRLMDRYFSTMTRVVAQFDGVVSNMAGDEMIAVWAHQNEAWCCRQACETSLDMLKAVEKFNLRNPKTPLPTRIGVHWGPLSFGSLRGHAPLGAFGDTVNTASRLQNLNKLLRTKVLISAQAMRITSEYLARDLGVFALRGKSIPTQVFELIGHTNSASASARRLCAEFAVALATCKEGRIEDGLNLFRTLLVTCPDDGPSAFYVQYIAEHRDWDGGAIAVD